MRRHRRERTDVIRRHRHDCARGRLPKQRRGVPERYRDVARFRKIDTHAEPRVEAAFCKRYREPAFGAVVRRPDEAGADRVDQQLLERALAIEVQCRRFASDQIVQKSQILAASELAPIIAEEHHPIAHGAELTSHRLARVLEQADDADHRRRIDRLAVGLVVEADVATSDRNIERATRVADPADGFRKLPHDLRALGIAEVEVVGGADRFAASAGDVAGRLGDCQHRAAVRIEITEAAAAIDGNRQTTIAAFDPDDPR